MGDHQGNSGEETQMKDAKMTGAEEKAVARREFLKIAGTAAPAAIVAIAAAPGQAEAAGAEAPAKGLQDTAHVRAYYASARF